MSCFIPFIIILICSIFVTETNSSSRFAALRKKQCNLYQGTWVYDQSYPLYDSTQCPFIRKEFDSRKYGRTDRFYLSYKWQPANRNLPKFDGRIFLEKFRGKKIMFIGDSLSLNIFESFACLLHASVPNATVVQKTSSEFTLYTFQEHGVVVALHHSLFIVDVEVEPRGRVLKLNSIKSGEVWKKMDVLVLNTWQWWDRRGPKQPWDYVQNGMQMLKDMDRMEAFPTALTTWANWVNTQADTRKTEEEWNEPGVTNCAKETRPINGTKYPRGLPETALVIKDVRRTIVKKAVTLLDITNLSQLRKDEHPAMHNGLDGMD